jgi:hypothetical protein
MLCVQTNGFLIRRTLGQFASHRYILHAPPISITNLMILTIFTTQMQFQLHLISTTDKDEGLALHAPPPPQTQILVTIRWETGLTSDPA